jgi:glycosyltransferase involved in cell wall biosynthesis
MAASEPRVVLAVPLYNKADFLPTALDSLLGQTYRDFGLVLVDDCSTDTTPFVAERYARSDDRIVFRDNQSRLGVVGNTLRAFELARQTFPTAEYFAWGSDHDIWRPTWLETMIEWLDRGREAVLVYPQNIRISDTGEQLRRPWRFSTAGEPSPRRRLLLVYENMRAGDMVYGLFRFEALERAGVYRWVTAPDRLLICELSLQGELHQVPEVLWERRFEGLSSRSRTRQTFFPDGGGHYIWAPLWVQHASAFFWSYVARGEHRPTIGRLRGLFFWSTLLGKSTVFYARRRVVLMKRSRRRRRIQRQEARKPSQKHLA